MWAALVCGAGPLICGPLFENPRSKDVKPALKSLTTIAALPQAGGCMANLPAEGGASSSWTTEMRRRQAIHEHLVNVCGVQIRSSCFDEPLTYPPIDLGLVEGCK